MSFPSFLLDMKSISIESNSKMSILARCMGKMPDKTPKFVNTGINTDPLNWDEFEVDSQSHSHASKLKKQNDVKHIHITDSSVLQTSYNFGQVLGQGSFGKVISVSEKQNGTTWAMKIIPKTAPKKMTSINREILILKLVKHPHIIYLHKIFESTEKIYLVMEKCIGELRQKFQSRKPFTEGDTRNVITQLSNAVDYLHKNEIVHRDLKLENILLAQNPKNPQDDLYIKVSDFGLGFVKGAHYERMHDRCGTLTYISPEIIMKGTYSQQCDIWALGVIMYLLLTGEFPFFSMAESELTRMICHAEPQFTSLGASVEAKHLLKKMLEKDPALRITAGEICMHPWLHGKLLSENTLSANVLDMMKMWKQDMMVPRGSDCDWATAAVHEDNRAGAAGSGRTNRQSMSLPVHNIEFNRGRAGGSSNIRRTSAEGQEQSQSHEQTGAATAAGPPRANQRLYPAPTGKQRMTPANALGRYINQPNNTRKDGHHSKRN
nr:serine/threonine-protein kinase 33-like [Onthophagus taurus]